MGKMKHFSAQYVFTNTGPPLKRALVTANDDGTIISVENTDGKLYEKQSVEFYNGVIIPGFVNCHCHLELSHMKGIIPEGTGLSSFLTTVSTSRGVFQQNEIKAIKDADNEMYEAGVVLCADVCNSSLTFDIKRESDIRYLNLLEVFGIDPSKAKKRMNDVMELADKARELLLPHWIVPHSVYSISLPLFKLIKKHTSTNKITSIHFMESRWEEVFLKNHTGPLMDSYKRFLLPDSILNTANDHISAILEELTSSGNLILVHNTFIERDHIEKLRKRNNVSYCLCPNSNLFIEKTLPPVELLAGEGCEIIIGTDSLSSNSKLNILEELKTLQINFPLLILEDLIRWATINGARALGEDYWAGKIEPGMKPGLLLVQDIDLTNLKLLPESNVRRLL
jgi:cytosine/adenosine deaminase-related metal-dependent hydrolase